MLIASLSPEIYLKSNRTQRRLIGAVVDAITDACDGHVTVERLAGHRLAIADAAEDPTDRLTRVFGIRSVESVVEAPASDVGELARRVGEHFAPKVRGRTFAVRPHRLGAHDWSSQDLAVAAGDLLVAAGGRVDLSNPELTVRVRIVGDHAYLTDRAWPGVGGLPIGTQGTALALFSGGIDSPVAAFMLARRGVGLDYLHFSLGCGQADHAAGIAHLLQDRYGAGSDPTLHVVELDPILDQLSRRVPARERQMALKGLMYRAAAAVASRSREISALVTGESIGQVSTQTLANLTALDSTVSMPILRPLLGLDKDEIMDRSRRIGTFEVSTRTRETCDISGGARVSVAMSASKLLTMVDEIDDLVDHAVTTTKSMRLADWVPGS